MNIYVRKLASKLLLFSLISLLVACTDDNENLQGGNGYVQFKLYKSASYEKSEASRAGDNRVDYLNDAKKVKVLLTSEDFSFSQTLSLNAYNDENAEYGLRSEKLELLPGEYTISGYYLYGKTEEQIFAGIPSEKTTFTIVSGGLVVQDLLVDAIGRGLVKFELIKNIQASRGASDSDPYPLAILIRWILRFRTWIPKRRKSLSL